MYILVHREREGHGYTHEQALREKWCVRSVGTDGRCHWERNRNRNRNRNLDREEGGISKGRGVGAIRNEQTVTAAARAAVAAAAGSSATACIHSGGVVVTSLLACVLVSIGVCTSVRACASAWW